MRLDITTPERLLVSAEIESLQVPGQNGYMGVLPQHAPLISKLAPGTIEYKEVGGAVERLAVSIGYVEVLPQQVSILAETAEKKDEIDVPRAEASKKRAEDRLKAGRDTDLDRAAISLARAMARIQTARK